MKSETKTDVIRRLKKKYPQIPDTTQLDYIRKYHPWLFYEPVPLPDFMLEETTAIINKFNYETLMRRCDA